MKKNKVYQLKLEECQLTELRKIAKELGYSNPSEMIRREILFNKCSRVKNVNAN